MTASVIHGYKSAWSSMAGSWKHTCLAGTTLLQITRLGDKIGKLSPMQRKLGIRRILGAVSEAYGRMMLYEGLFQADGHPGNILVMKGGVPLTLCMAEGHSKHHPYRTRSF